MVGMKYGIKSAYIYTYISVVSHEAREDAASEYPDWTQDALHMSILHEAELGNLKMS